MQVGINYAWKNYAWDFGLPPQKNSGSSWGARAAWQPTLDKELAEFVDIGFFCVRWFLLGDGTTYGVGAERPHLDPRGNGQWRFDSPPQISDEFLKDFDRLLTCCEKAGIQLLPSLVDFHFCFPGIPIPGSDGIVKSGRHDVLIDPRKRTPFFDNVLRPLLRVAGNHKAAIYAFEVMNEPEWCTLPPGATDSLNPNKSVPLNDMRAFLSEGAAIINDAGFRSTVGFAMYPTLKLWDSQGLGVTLHQFHFYAEPALIPPHSFDPRWPVIVGEFATAPHRPWTELGAAQDVLSRLRHIEEKGYPAAFLWSANREEEHSSDPSSPVAVDFSEANRALMRRYIRGAG